MAQANAATIKVTYEIDGKLAHEFHVWAAVNKVKKNHAIGQLLQSLVSGRVKLGNK